MMSVLGLDLEYIAKYNPLPSGFPLGFALVLIRIQYSIVQYSTVQYSTVHSQSTNNGLLKYNGGIYPPRQTVFPSES